MLLGAALATVRGQSGHEAEGHLSNRRSLEGQTRVRRRGHPERGQRQEKCQEVVSARILEVRGRRVRLMETSRLLPCTGRPVLRVRGWGKWAEMGTEQAGMGHALASQRLFLPRNMGS